MTTPDATDALATLAAKLDEVSEMLEARYPEDDVRRTFALVLIMDFGLQRMREQWTREHQQAHGCELTEQDRRRLDYAHYVQHIVNRESER
jgi:hypothetical protein